MFARITKALDVLDPDNEYDLFVLQCMFLPRNNKRLAAFAQAWNFHPLRTERNWSPRQIMINSIIKECDIRGEGPEAPPSEYGVDYGGPLPDDQKLFAHWMMKRLINSWIT